MMKTFIKEALITLGLAIVLYVALTFVIQNSPVIGSSMEPNLLPSGQRILVSRVAYWFQTPQRGDIVTLHPPKDWNNPSGHPFVKRIIGLPGETVEIKDNKVYINDVALDEPYLSPNVIMRTMPAVTVPADSYFVLGDNREVSEDSSYAADNHLADFAVPRSGIIGKAWLSIWPASTWGLAPNYSHYNVDQTIPAISQ